MESVPHPSGHNSIDRNKSILRKKYSAQYNVTKFLVSTINEHADTCLDRQTTPTRICFTSEDKDKNLEENDSRTISHNSLNSNDIVAIISTVNDNCRVINNFSIKVNIR